MAYIKPVDVVASLGHCLLTMNLVGQGNDERSHWRCKDLANDLENKKMILLHKVASIIALNFFVCDFSILQFLKFGFCNFDFSRIRVDASAPPPRW